MVKSYLEERALCSKPSTSRTSPVTTQASSRGATPSRYLGCSRSASRAARAAPGRRYAALDAARFRHGGRQLSFWYGQHRALKNLNFTIADRHVTALIGPSGCGKSTFLRCFNRMHDLHPGTRYEGRIMLHPDNLNLVGPASTRSKCACASAWCSRSRIRSRSRSSRTSPTACGCAACASAPARRAKSRRRCAARRSGTRSKDRLHESALALSGGQQQRLCIARALATTPEILLFDEPTSALDPIATAKIEELISTLRDQVTVLIVTHNMQQAARVSDYTAFMYLGELDRVRRDGEDLHEPDARRRRRTTSPAATADGALLGSTRTPSSSPVHPSSLVASRIERSQRYARAARV